MLVDKISDILFHVQLTLSVCFVDKKKSQMSFYNLEFSCIDWSKYNTHTHFFLRQNINPFKIYH